MVSIVNKKQYAAKIRRWVIHQIDVRKTDRALPDIPAVAVQINIHEFSFLIQMYYAVLTAQNHLKPLVWYRLCRHNLDCHFYLN